GRRATVSIADLSIGPFHGELQFTLYATSRLVQVEAVVSTREDRRAILYDAGLAGDSPGWQSIAWLDVEGRFQRAGAPAPELDRSIAVRHRALIAEGEHGSVACFPP